MATGRRRRASGAPVEVALVHRARRDDWSLPKGKLEAGETWAAGAVRETREETGHRVRPRGAAPDPALRRRRAPQGRPLLGGALVGPDRRHRRGRGRRARSGCRRAKRVRRLSYAHDTEVVDSFLAVVDSLVAAADPPSHPLPDVDVLVVLRHARAVKRAAWDGADDLRPLDDRGVTESVALTDWLAAYGPDRVLSSDSARCLDTVRPYALSRDLVDRARAALLRGGLRARSTPRAGPARGRARRRRSYGALHPPARAAEPAAASRRTPGRSGGPAAPPGGAVIVHHVKGSVVSVERHGPEDLLGG